MHKLTIVWAPARDEWVAVECRIARHSIPAATTAIETAVARHLHGDVALCRDIAGVWSALVMWCDDRPAVERAEIRFGDERVILYLDDYDHEPAQLLRMEREGRC
jgi:hypothetical protein